MADYYLRMSLANSITCLRILLAPIITALLFAPEVPYSLAVAAGLFVLAMLTDLVDGRIARAYKQASQVGGHLDGLADKLLWNLLLFSFAAFGLVPFWFAAIVFTRDALATEFKSIAAIRGVKMAVTSFEGKAKVALQSVGLCFGFAALLGSEYWPLALDYIVVLAQLCMGCFVIALLFGLVNFYKDVVRNFKKVLR